MKYELKTFWARGLTKLEEKKHEIRRMRGIIVSVKLVGIDYEIIVELPII